MGLYKIKTISQLSGYPPEVLRAWERRHGLLRPVRTGTGHRLYTEEDLTVLREIRRRLEAGRSIGELALVGREELLGQTPSSLGEPAGLEAWRQRALRSALELDAQGLERVLDEAFAQAGPDRVVEGLILPNAHEIGLLWASGRASVAAEHLQSAVYTRRLEGMIEAGLRYARPQPLCVVSCLEGETHELGARLVTWYLVREGVAPLYAAPGLPLAELESLCLQREPAAVLLSVTREALLASQLEAVLGLASRVRSRVFLGGAAVGRHRVTLERAGILCWPAERSLRELRAALEA